MSCSCRNLGFLRIVAREMLVVTISHSGPGALMALGGPRTGCVAQEETSLALHSSSLEPMTPRDRVLLSECCFISPNFSLLFRIITNKKSRPVWWKRGLVVTTTWTYSAACSTTNLKETTFALAQVLIILDGTHNMEQIGDRC